MQIGMNVNESLLTDYGPQYYYRDLMKTARGYRTFRGAVVDQNHYPKFTTPGDSLSRIEYQFAHFLGGLPKPYHGNFRLVTDGDGHIEITRRDRNGKVAFGLSAVAQKQIIKARIAAADCQ